MRRDYVKGACRRIAEPRRTQLPRMFHALAGSRALTDIDRAFDKAAASQRARNMDDDVKRVLERRPDTSALDITEIQ